jgi:hypothetical protein
MSKTRKNLATQSKRAKATKKTRWLPLFAVAIYSSRKSYKFEAEGFYMKNLQDFSKHQQI